MFVFQEKKLYLSFSVFPVFLERHLTKTGIEEPALFNKLSKLFRDVQFWSAQTQNSMETLFLSERANTQLFRTQKIFEIGPIFVKLEGILY